MKEIPIWLSISDAAQKLGVHFTTLRRWADQGLIEHIRTPGGKRKFSRQSIEEFIDRHRSDQQTPVAMVQIKDQMVAKTREELHARGMANQNWYLQLNDEQRMQMRITGNRLIALMFQYCARDTNGDVFLEEGHHIAEYYGQICQASGLTLGDCIRTFLFFRGSLLSSVHETGSLRGMEDQDSHRLFMRMSYFLDEIMVSMVLKFNELNSNFTG